MDTHKEEKILILITKGTVGGAQSFVVQLVKGLLQEGHNVSVGFGEGDFLESECRRMGITMQRISTLRRSFNPIVNLRAVIQIRSLLKRERYDVLHINSSNALFAAVSVRMLKQRPRVIFTFHGLSLLEKNANISSVARYAYLFVTKLLLFFIDEVVFVSNANFQKAQRLKLVTHGHVIYNGIDLEESSFLSRSRARAEISALADVDLSDAFIVGSVGRFSDEKNYEFLIDTWARYKESFSESKLVLIGDGPQKELLKEKVSVKDIHNVFFVGEIKEAHRYLLAFDVFVLCSRYEGMSVSILEALFAGVPVLGSDVGGIREQVPNNNEQIFAFGDHEDFHSKLLFLTKNNQLRDQISREEKNHSRKFLAQDMITKYVNIYTQT